MTGEPEEDAALEGEHDVTEFNKKTYLVSRLIDLANTKEATQIRTAQIVKNEAFSKLDPDRVEAADTSYAPIVVNTEAGYYLIDGYHRLEKINRGKAMFASVKVLEESELDAAELKSLWSMIKGKLTAANELYQEEETSTFTHWGKNYNLNSVLAAIEKRPVRDIPLKAVAWCIEDDLDEARVNAADTSHPLIISKEDGVYYVLDGNHRLKKLSDEGATSVPVKYITEKELQAAKVAGPALEKEATFDEVYKQSGLGKKVLMRFVSLFGYKPDLAFQKEDVDLNVVAKLLKRKDLLADVESWISDTDYSLLPKLEEAKRVFSPITQAKAKTLYRGFNVTGTASSKQPEISQQRTGVDDIDAVEVGSTYQHTPDKPMSFSWHAPTADAYGDIVVSVDFNKNKNRMLHITHEMALAMFLMDDLKDGEVFDPANYPKEKFPDDFYFFTYAEAVYIPDGKPLEFTLVKKPKGFIGKLKDIVKKIFK